MVEMLMHAFTPSLYEALGIFLSLIVVNCIILGRAEMYASKNNVIDSAIDALGMGVGFTLALFLMSSIREILGSGSWLGFAIPWLSDNPIMIFSVPAGGFFVFGCLIALVNKITKKHVDKKDIGCEGCPSAYLCGKKRQDKIVREGDDK
jgi:electron transport complex protein RnfE